MLLVLACVMPAAAMAFGLIFYFYERELTQVQAGAISTARALAAALDQHVIGAQASIATLASSELLHEGNLAAFDKRARAVKINEQAANVVLVDMSGHQL
ncbi:MAG: PAS domain-containing sensor histidine kinase, partial [Polaromonas sp.]